MSREERLALWCVGLSAFAFGMNVCNVIWLACL